MSAPPQNVPDWVTLTDGEEVVWSGQPSIYPILSSLVAGFLVALGGFVLYILLPQDLAFRWVVYLLVPLGVLLMGVAYVRHTATRYVVTTNEVYKKTGLFSRDVTSLRLDRVQNTSFSQSLGQRLLSYGDVNVDTAGTGGTEITFESVANPQKVSSLLTRQLDRTTPRAN
ncbi:PH domain-containing protein [Halomarina litorea]|uniref:PH domain-containing protein n=1 Tax=Halomarina litorea TaxID=2961595 RepID=UPI0020C49B6A|nr:PH domain-containing protein [Halomarina sp. BCD28]